MASPMIAIRDAPDSAPVEAWLRRFGKGACDDLVLMTGEGLRRLLGFARRLDLEATFLTALGSAPDAVIASYGAASSHGGGAGLQATNVARYLSINAGGPAGTTYVNICVSGNSFGAAFFQHAYELPEFARFRHHDSSSAS
jgi:hypothetical protein